MGGLMGLYAYFVGLNWEIIFIWITLMILDIMTGVIKAAKNKNFSSKDMKKGLYKKAGEFFLLFALILGQRVGIIVGIDIPVAPIFIGAFSFKDLGSIIENAIDIGVGVPSIVKKWFKIANDSINQGKVNEDK